MKRIKNLKDLKSERARLKLELNVAEEVLKDDIAWIKSEFQPVHLAAKYLSTSLVNKDKGIINDGVRSVIDTVLKGVVLSKAGWITKLVVPFIVKNISSNYITEKKPEIFSMLKRFISKVRRTTNSNDNIANNTNHNHNNNSRHHFDKSTVDEMDY